MKIKHSTKHKYNLKTILRLACIVYPFLMTLIIGKYIFASKDTVQANQSEKCEDIQQLNLINQNNYSLQESTNDNESKCYQFLVQPEQQLTLNSNTEVKIQYPDNRISVLLGEKDIVKPGKYFLIVENNKDFQLNINVKQANNLLAKNTDSSQLIQTKAEDFPAIPQEKNLPKQLTYNQTIPPFFQKDQKLQNIVNDIVAIAKKRNLRTDKLSISLVNLNSNNFNCCAYASFADDRRRYPASVVKLLWMVVLFGQYETHQLEPGTVSQETLIDMIQDSDNEASSKILDAVTKTESGSPLSPENIKAWKAQRDTVNYFFEQAGYTDVNISQKTYPIPYLKMNLPTGRDKQLRDKNLELRQQEVNPIRNYLTTRSVARLLYEIHSNQSISPRHSDEMKNLLSRDLNPAVWKNKPYNAIAGFLGEGLPADTIFYSKMGWTFNNRNDSAIVVSPDGKARYILVVFGDDKSFYEDKEFLPEISKFVYQQMTNY